MNKRQVVVVTAGAVSMLGWGAVLPYQYAYAAQTRGWGALVAASSATLFSVGALVAAPIGGRLADRLPPVRVAVVAKLVAAAAALVLLVAGDARTFLLGMLVLGLGVTAAQPAQSLLILRWSGTADRRTAFAWAFTGSSVGMAVGALIASRTVHLESASGMVGAFALAAGGFVASAALLAVASYGDALPAHTRDEQVAAGGAGSAVRAVLRVPALRWIALVTVLISLGFYAQFESGLPAYALTVLEVPEQTIGTAAAVNCVVIVVLQMLVVKATRRRRPATLLVWVGVIWLVCWGALSLVGLVPAAAAVTFVATYGVFAVGETLFAPVLGPLSAAHAPEGMAGTTLGLLSAVQTGVSAVGPLLAGVALGAGHGGVFLGVHLGISAAALAAALRLRRVLGAPVDRSLAADSPVDRGDGIDVVRVA